jgi:hypothetical protein
MVYNAPVLVEVGQATSLVLGFNPGIGDGTGGDATLAVDLALGLDE